MKIVIFKEERELTDGQLLRLVEIGLGNLVHRMVVEKAKFPRKDGDLLALLRVLIEDFNARGEQQLAVPNGTGGSR